MIPRYTPKEFAAALVPRDQVPTWLAVELAACEAMERAGIVPGGYGRGGAPVDRASTWRASIEIELETKHDVIAFLTHVEELAGRPRAGSTAA
jgi:adenylosuccinate lyase